MRVRRCGKRVGCAGGGGDESESEGETNGGGERAWVHGVAVSSREWQQDAARLSKASAAKGASAPSVYLTLSSKSVEIWAVMSKKRNRPIVSTAVVLVAVWAVAWVGYSVAQRSKLTP